MPGFERRRHSLALQFFPNLSWYSLVQGSRSGCVEINVVVQTPCFCPIFIHLDICSCWYSGGIKSFYHFSGMILLESSAKVFAICIWLTGEPELSCLNFTIVKWSWAIYEALQCGCELTKAEQSFQGMEPISVLFVVWAVLQQLMFRPPEQFCVFSHFRLCWVRPQLWKRTVTGARRVSMTDLGRGKNL